MFPPLDTSWRADLQRVQDCLKRPRNHHRLTLTESRAVSTRSGCSNTCGLGNTLEVLLKAGPLPLRTEEVFRTNCRDALASFASATYIRKSCAGPLPGPARDNRASET